MTRTSKYVKIFSVSALFIGIFAGALPALADSRNEPWTFQTQNRASIAALMKQVDEAKSNSGTTAGIVGGSVTNLVCGNGADSSTAEGNSACIILNNSTGDIDTGQDTTGNQTADNAQTDTTNVNETINGQTDTQLGSVLEGLNGN